MERDSPSGSTPLLYRVFQPGMLMLLACAAGSAVLTPWFLRQLPDLKSRPEYRLPFSKIELLPPPSGKIPSDLRDQVQRQHDFPDDVSILDPTLAKRLAEAFGKHPWIEEVREVRLNHPPRIVIGVVYRRPAALVSAKTGFYPIDPDGVLLPPADFTPKDAETYPVVKNIRSVPAGPAGTLWGDPVVFAAARLADALLHDWPDLQLTAIIAPKPLQAAVDPADLMFELTTRGGSKIIWGRAPGSGHPGELSAMQKIGRMQKYLREFGGFDQPRGPYEIDIRHWQEITRRPLNPRRIDAAMEERIPVR
jgi:hypothetical protein